MLNHGYLEKRDRLSAALKKQNERSQSKICLQKETSNLFRPRLKNSRDLKLDVRQCNQVLLVDPITMTAEVEGMATYEAIVSETLKYACLPAVVPELKSITVGGALSGCGIESSSFRYGLVHETILEIDVLLSNGKVITCTPDNEYNDLFFAFPNTFGTLGYALKVKMKLIPAKKYVKLAHQKFQDPEHFFSSIKEQCNGNDADYIEGVIFSPREMSMSLATCVDEVPFESDYTYKNIYYRSLQKNEVDYLTTYDYIWRWDADWFWCSDVFGMQNRVLRALFGKVLLGSKRFNKIMHFFHRHPLLSRALNVFSHKQESIIQDVCVSVDQAACFYAFLREKIGIHPIWICPTKRYDARAKFDFFPLKGNLLYLDFGFWKSIPTEKERGYHNRLIEKKVADLQGFKSLYSLSYYSKQQFWALYNEPRYRELKKRYDPDNRLRDFYEKCSAKNRF